MIITIVQSEIENAVKDYVASKIKLEDNQSFKIELLATRGSQGITANIEICDADPVRVPAKAQFDDCVAECDSYDTNDNKQESFEADSAKKSVDNLESTEEKSQHFNEFAADTKEVESTESKSIFSQPEKKKNPFADLA